MGGDGRGQQKQKKQPEFKPKRNAWERKITDKTLVAKLRIYSAELAKLEAGQTTPKARTAEAIPIRGLRVEKIVGRLRKEAMKRIAA
jgi:hypothetical protein